MPAASSLAIVLLGATLAATSPEPLLRIQDPALVESSGLAVSVWHEGILWTHADGGSVAEVRALDSSGETVATVTLEGIDPYDPEALAPGDRQGLPTLFLGDIGDNLEKRPDVSVFRFAEPLDVRDQTVEATWYRFTYPDGPHDAEALLVHPGTGRLLIATKSAGGGGLYEAPSNLLTADEGSNRLVRVSDVPPLVTDGAYLPDGRFALRTYGSVFVYDRPGHQVATATLPLQPQGESLAVDGDRGILLVGSEGPRSTVYAVPIPVAASQSSSPDSRSGTDPRQDRAGNADGESPDASSLSTVYRVARVVGILLLLAGLVAYFRRTRRR
ncbi:MAG: hypothetical protein LH461_10190 [Spirochaetaceae bacterium]|nr:hypothetical protein [Spirochaetaceae bacterium]